VPLDIHDERGFQAGFREQHPDSQIGTQRRSETTEERGTIDGLSG
jgi:hypothetical protein